MLFELSSTKLTKMKHRFWPAIVLGELFQYLYVSLRKFNQQPLSSKATNTRFEVVLHVLSSRYHVLLSGQDNPVGAWVFWQC